MQKYALHLVPDLASRDLLNKLHAHLCIMLCLPCNSLHSHEIPCSSMVHLLKRRSTYCITRPMRCPNKFSTFLVLSENMRDTDPCNLPLFCNEGDTVANPANCSTYLQCLFGVSWTERPCPSGLNFDKDRKICDTNLNCQEACPAYTGPTTPQVSQGTSPEPSE